jgi:ribosomal protein S10
MMQFILKAYHKNFLLKNIKIIQKTFGNCKIMRLPSKTKKWTVIRSPHIHKKSREQFQMKIFSIIISIDKYNINAINIQKLNCIGIQLQIRLTEKSHL